jgi:hypothetical protein
MMSSIKFLRTTGSGMVSGQSKVSEAAVRGMWHAWRQQMEL